MPLILLHLPKHCFSTEQKNDFAEKATQTLLEIEGMSQNKKAQNISWVQIYEFEQHDFFLAGHTTEKPHYRLEIKVFQGTLNEPKKEALTQKLTNLILDIENSDHNLLNAARIWVMIEEIPDGNWGGAGKIYRIKDLMSMMK